MKLEVNRRKIEYFSSGNTLLNNQWVQDEIKKIYKKYFKTNEKENTTYQNLYNTAKQFWKGTLQ